MHAQLPEGVPLNDRRRHLVMDLSEQSEPVPVDKVMEITARVAKTYANKSYKTIARDLKKLIEMDLVEYREDKVRAKKEKVLGMRPFVAKPEEKKPKESPLEKSVAG